MIATVQIQARHFAAALKCAAKNDVRYCLNGVYLDFPRGRIVSTTGHIMFIGKIDGPILDDSVVVSPVIVPRTLIESALKTLTKKVRESEFTLAVTITPTSYGVPPTVTLHAGSGGQFSAPAIDGHFPEYERVVPEKTSGVIAQFDPEYVSACADAMRLYTGIARTMPEIQHNGDSPSIATQTDCLCVIMPVRTGPHIDADWYFKPLQGMAQAA